MEALMSTSLTKVSISILEVEGFPQIFRRSSQQTTSVTSGKKPVKDFMDVSSKESTRYQLLWAIWTWAKENRKSWTPQKPPWSERLSNSTRPADITSKGLSRRCIGLVSGTEKEAKLRRTASQLCSTTPSILD